MGLFGGPNVQKLLEKGDVGQLAKTYVENRKEKTILEAKTALLSLGEGAIEPLLNAAADDRLDTETRIHQIFSEFPGRAIEPLREALNNGTVMQQIVAMRYLSSIHDVDSVEPIAAKLSCNDDSLRMKAIEALRDLGGASAIEALRGLLGQKATQPEHLYGTNRPSACLESTAQALLDLDSEAGLEEVIQQMSTNAENLASCHAYGTLLRDLTGTDVIIYWEVNTWLEWWNARQLGNELDPQRQQKNAAKLLDSSSTMAQVLAFLERQGYQLAPNGPTSKVASDPSGKRPQLVVIEGGDQIIFMSGYFTGANAKAMANRPRFLHFIQQLDTLAIAAKFPADPDCNIAMVGSVKKNASLEDVVDFFARWDADHALVQRGLPGEFAGEFKFFMN